MKRGEGLISTNIRQYKCVLFTIYFYGFLPKETVVIFLTEVVINKRRYSRKMAICFLVLKIENTWNIKHFIIQLMHNIYVGAIKCIKYVIIFYNFNFVYLLYIVL